MEWAEWSGLWSGECGVVWSGECGVEWFVEWSVVCVWGREWDVRSAVPLSGVGSGVEWGAGSAEWSGVEWGVRSGVACGGRVECSAAEWSGEWS